MGFKKKEQAVFPASYKFKILLYVNFFVILYSILHCQVHHGLTDKRKEKTVKNIMFGRKIVYDLSNLVYNDTIQNSCIPKLLLFTSVLFDILGYVLSQNF